MRYPPIAQGASIIAVGNLNPAIFHPSWLRLHNIISEEELSIATVSIVHPEVTEFTIDTLSLQVTPQRISIQTTEVPYVRIADMMVSIFGDLLSHTPLQKFGINLTLHFGLGEPTKRVALGRALAPLGPWGEWGKALETDKLSTTGGLRSLALEEWSFPERREGSYRRVQVEPSLLHTPPRPADVFILVNDHFELEAAKTTEIFVDTLTSNFDKSIAESTHIVSGLMEYAAGLR